MAKTGNMEELFRAYESKMQEYIVTDNISNLIEKIISTTDEINNILSKDKQMMLQELLELEHERASLEEQKVFTYAFVLGIKVYKEIEQVANLL